MDPTDDRKLYIGVEQDGFFKTTDGGATWLRATNGLKAWPRLNEPGVCFEEFYATMINPRNPNELCIALAGGPGLLSTRGSQGNNGVYCSSDAAGTWVQRVTPSMNLAVYALAADPRDFKTMYAGVNGGPCSNGPPICPEGTYFNTTGAVYKSTDGGASWTELNARYIQDQRVIVVRVNQQDPRIVVASTFGKLPNTQSGPGNFGGAEQSGLLRSTDGGQTWLASTSGMRSDPREQALLDLDIAPRNGMNLYLTASSNTGYWSDDGGQTFNSSARLDAFAFDPHDGLGLHMLGVSGGQVRESRDGGKTWMIKSTTPGYVSQAQGVPTAVVWSQTNAQTVFLAGPYASIWRSIDGGGTWAQILSGERLPK